jgi:ATP-binding cassette subfamily B protein
LSPHGSQVLREKLFLRNATEKTYITREGVSLLGISEAAEKIGFRTLGVRTSLEILNDTPIALYSALETTAFRGAV